MNQLNHDDEGIIDLRALASTPPRSGNGVIVAPLFSEPPPAFTIDAEEEQAPRRSSRAKTFGIIAASAFVVALAGTGLAFGLKRNKPVAAAAAAPAPPPPPVVAAPVAAPPPATVAATPAPAPTADTPADDATTKKGKAGKARGAKSKAKSADSTSSAPAAPAAAKPKAAPAAKAADPCNCHGDFQCNIRCSAGK
jgi:hypothetical protein